MDRRRGERCLVAMHDGVRCKRYHFIMDNHSPVIIADATRQRSGADVWPCGFPHRSLKSVMIAHVQTAQDVVFSIRCVKAANFHSFSCRAGELLNLTHT